MNYSLKNDTIFASGRSQQRFILLNGDHKLLSLIYDSSLQTARLECNSEKRLFMVYNEGRRLPKTVFKNEYGFDIGTLEHITENGFGKIGMYGNNYYYRLMIDDNCTMFLYDNIHAEPLSAVYIEPNDMESALHFDQHKIYYHLLYCALLSICWYLQLPENAQEVVITPTDASHFLSV